MRSSSLTLLIVVLIIIVVVQPSNARASAYFQASDQDLSDEQYKRVLQDPILREVVEDESQEQNLFEARADTVDGDMLTGAEYGGNGGAPFNDVDVIGEKDIYIPTAIYLRAGTHVDAIQINYTADDGTQRVALHRGGQGGGGCQFVLDSDEVIVKVTGTYGKYIDSLLFTTNKGRTGPSCANGKGGGTFTEEHPGYVLSYVSGRYGRLLDKIQFHWIRALALIDFEYYGCGKTGKCWRGCSDDQKLSLYGPRWCYTSNKKNSCKKRSDCSLCHTCVENCRKIEATKVECKNGLCMRGCTLKGPSASDKPAWCSTTFPSHAPACKQTSDCSTYADCVEPCHVG